MTLANKQKIVQVTLRPRRNVEMMNEFLVKMGMLPLDIEWLNSYQFAVKQYNSAFIQHILQNGQQQLFNPHTNIILTGSYNYLVTDLAKLLNIPCITAHSSWTIPSYFDNVQFSFYFSYFLM